MMELEMKSVVETLVPVKPGTVFSAGEHNIMEYKVIGHVDGKTVVKNRVYNTYSELTGLGIHHGYKMNDEGYLCTVESVYTETLVELKTGDTLWADVDILDGDDYESYKFTVIHVMEDGIIVGTKELTYLDNIFIIDVDGDLRDTHGTYYDTRNFRKNFRKEA